MSIDVITQDLVDRVKTVAGFSNRVGLAVGGQEIDPINRELTRPAAWCLYVGEDVESDTNRNPCSSLVRMNFIVKVLVDYDNETNLINTHLPLLHEVVQAVQGGEPVPGSQFAYNGMGLEALEPDRMVWQQQYSILMSIT